MSKGTEQKSARKEQKIVKNSIFGHKGHLTFFTCLGHTKIEHFSHSGQILTISFYNNWKDETECIHFDIKTTKISGSTVMTVNIRVNCHCIKRAMRQNSELEEQKEEPIF